MSKADWNGPITKYEVTVLGEDDVLDDLAMTIRAWAASRGRRFFVWRAITRDARVAELEAALRTVAQWDEWAAQWLARPESKP